MNFGHVSATDWMIFTHRFPEADAFLNKAALFGELRSLENNPSLTPTLQKRLEELRDWATKQRHGFGRLQVIEIPYDTMNDGAKEHFNDGYPWSCQCGESYQTRDHAENCKKCRTYLTEPATKVFLITKEVKHG